MSYSFFDIVYLLILVYVIYRISLSDFLEAEDKRMELLQKKKYMEYKKKAINYIKYQQKRNRNFKERKKNKNDR